MFARFEGEVLDRGDYLVIRTPSNPDYHWGNYIIFAGPPQTGDFDRWRSIYRAEFPYYDSIKHMTFTWNEDSAVTPVFEPFLKSGFKLDRAKVLTASKVHLPPKTNSSIRIKVVETPDEWEQAIQLQVACRDPGFGAKSYETFKRRQFETYRKMAHSGLGSWFAAFLGNRMVGDLGIFHEDGIARYQNVGTHPDFRRQGICGSLVYEAAKIAFRDYRVKTLVMEADADYHAAAIYESVGFRPTEENQSLSWWTE